MFNKLKQAAKVGSFEFCVLLLRISNFNACVLLRTLAIIGRREIDRQGNQGHGRQHQQGTYTFDFQRVLLFSFCLFCFVVVDVLSFFFFSN